MKTDVMRITPIAEPGRSHVLDLALECGHRVRAYDPGQSLRPMAVDCYKCDRNLPVDAGGGGLMPVEQLTIDRFIEVTKAHLLKSRRITPSVIIRLLNGDTAAAMIDPRLPTTEHRRSAYALAGVELARQVFPKAPDLVIISYECWLSQKPEQEPSQADDRRHCVLFSTYEANPKTMTVRRSNLIYEVLRRGGVDLVHRPDLSHTEELHAEGQREQPNTKMFDYLMGAFTENFLGEQLKLAQQEVKRG